VVVGGDISPTWPLNLRDAGLDVFLVAGAVDVAQRRGSRSRCSWPWL
jgi:hypothetical protein